MKFLLKYAKKRNKFAWFARSGSGSKYPILFLVVAHILGCDKIQPFGTGSKTRQFHEHYFSNKIKIKVK
jgi:hypothetical protein